MHSITTIVRILKIHCHDCYGKCFHDGDLFCFSTVITVTIRTINSLTTVIVSIAASELTADRLNT